MGKDVSHTAAAKFGGNCRLIWRFARRKMHLNAISINILTMCRLLNKHATIDGHCTNYARLFILINWWIFYVTIYYCYKREWPWVKYCIHLSWVGVWLMDTGITGIMFYHMWWYISYVFMYTYIVYLSPFYLFLVLTLHTLFYMSHIFQGIKQVYLCMCFWKINIVSELN